jgi:hypothetical protein
MADALLPGFVKRFLVHRFDTLSKITVSPDRPALSFPPEF